MRCRRLFSHSSQTSMQNSIRTSTQTSLSVNRSRAIGLPGVVLAVGALSLATLFTLTGQKAVQAGHLRDGAGDNNVANVRRIPAPGVEVPAADRAELEKGIAQLDAEIESLRKTLKPELRELLPDVQIYHNAVRYALKYNEFFTVREIGVGKTLLQHGLERAAQLKAGNHPWTSATGTIPRGYVSKIDGSVQPYGLIVPDGHTETSGPARLDLWFHGRGENLSELNFVNDREHGRGDFTPEGAFVLHPYGRYCNANRFAGEIDTLEAIEAVKKQYKIDPNRIVVRGFSMGGAACWQFATHFAGDWVAANPGAGFSETAEFLKLSQGEALPAWYQQRLWHWYDSIDYAENLFNTKTIAYSGEVDGQRQAAERMNLAMAAEGLKLTHIIGPKAGHFFEANAKKTVASLVDEAASTPRDDAPSHVRFSTWTLRYNRMKWVQIDGLEKHWAHGHVDAEITDPHTVALKTANVTALTLAIPTTGGTSSDIHLDPTAPVKVTLNGQTLSGVHGSLVDGRWTVHFSHASTPSNSWKVGEAKPKGLHKVHLLQGPIDDAFMSSFVIVTPTGAARNAKVGAWVKSEQEHAIEHWRRQYRGEAPVKTDVEITNQDIANSNLILFGDTASNKILARIASKLPIGWDAQGLKVGKQSYPGDHSVAVLIYPNPLNPKHYIVLNSGFTFREYDYLNNARQTPKLPDYAVVDIDTPANAKTPGAIVRAGFFDENWQVQDNDGQ